MANKNNRKAREENSVKVEKKNLIMMDTNVLINDPYSIPQFIDGGNTVVLALVVADELDKLKNNERIGHLAREAARQISELYFKEKNPLFDFEKNQDFEGLNLRHEKPDHQIIATFNYVIKNRPGFDTYKLVSSDLNVRLVASALFKDNEKVSVELYKKEQVERKKTKEDIKKLKVEISNVRQFFEYNEKVFGQLDQNAGIIVEYKSEADHEKTSLCFRKGSQLEIVSSTFSLLGISPKIDGNLNYGQLLAFHHCLNDDIKCLFLQGKTGSGKTLISIAAALHMLAEGKYRNIVVTNPMVALGNKDNVGFLPGDLNAKTAEWQEVFVDALEFLEDNDPKAMEEVLKKITKKKVKPVEKSSYPPQKEVAETILDKYAIKFKPLKFIRGRTIRNTIFIIDESQNLSQLEIKTIITRAGAGSKFIFTGDLDQIDIPFLTDNTSGLTYAIEKLTGEEAECAMIAAVMLYKTERSELAEFAGRML